MKETIDQYKARILGYTGGKDALATQRVTPLRLCPPTPGLSREQRAKKSAPDMWSIGEIDVDRARTGACTKGLRVLRGGFVLTAKIRLFSSLKDFPCLER